MTIKLHHWLVLLLLPILGSCYPEGAEYTDELDVVYTNYDNQFNFSSKRTYAIPDSVIKITGEVFNDPDGNGKPSFLAPNYSDAILGQIKQNMASAGWTLVNKSSSPDVVLLVSSITTTNVYYYYDWYYWDWWYPGWNPSWTWYYPGYYYPVYVDGYRSGSVFLQMVDHKAALSNDKVPVVWNCTINGLAEGSSTDLTTRVQNSINSAFWQSPYLKH